MALLDDIGLLEKRRMLYVLISVMFLIFFARLYQLQLIYREEYGKKSEENSIRTVPREPVRGYVYDRNGQLIVDNRPAFTVTITPFEFDRRTIPLLSGLLDLDTTFILERLGKGEAYSRFVPVKIKRDIDFRTLSALEENRDRLPGVDYQVESKRWYAAGMHAVHALGYTKEISEAQLQAHAGDYAPGDAIGFSGIEARYENELRGIKGAEFSTVNVRGQVIGRFERGKNDIPPVEGDDLYLTLDIGVQACAESLLADKRGAVVALDVETGGVLAIASKPDYDLSMFSGVTPSGLWQDLNTDEAAPMFNRSTLSRYPPGSTFKMLLAIAALERQVVTPSWRITCGGSFRVGNKVFKDLHVHGSVDMVEAIQRSCNVYFYQLMMKTGLDTWSHYGSEFGFGQLTGIDITEENPGLLPSTEYMDRHYGAGQWTRGYLPSFGIGQGDIGATPLQIACYGMALANRGAYHQPHLVAAVLDKQTRIIDTLSFPTRTITLQPSTWDVVREGMRRAVEEPGGTGALARVRGIVVAGKTGTAQNPHGPDHAWFVGFAPYEAPRIAIAVLVENAGFGGTAAAPIAGICIERYLYGRFIRFDRPPVVHAAAKAAPKTEQQPTVRN
jgi:penicillin-binding protein 2